MPTQWTDHYRPQSLDDIAGNPKVTRVLRALLSRPVPSAWLLEGPSGLGKTSAALVLARELASDMDVIQCNGQDMNADAVRAMAETVRLAPWKANGWRVVIVDEADQMSRAAQVLWLSLLENLGRCLVIFTSNERGDFEPRFLSRLKVLHFTAQGMARAGAERLMAIATREGLPLTDAEATKIMRDAGNNVRAAVQELELRAMLGAA